MVEQIRDMSRGVYIEDMDNTSALDFGVGVAGYPEKHFEAANMDLDIKYLKDKVDAGANYVVTQMFFDNSKFLEFVRRCREAGITVPIIHGL